MRTANALVAFWSELLRTDRRFVLANFGSFRVVPVKRRKTINPHTRALMQVPAGATVRFRPSPALRRAMSKRNEPPASH